MLCSSCGKDIPMAGSVCPYCHQDKSADKAWTTASFVAVLVALVGYFVAGFLGVVTGFAAGWAVTMAISRGGTSKQPETPRRSQAAADDSEVRTLAQLKQMHDQGLLSAEEFATKKAEVLSRM